MKNGSSRAFLRGEGGRGIKIIPVSTAQFISSAVVAKNYRRQEVAGLISH
jgi:hypothetical protein